MQNQLFTIRSTEIKEYKIEIKDNKSSIELTLIDLQSNDCYEGKFTLENLQQGCEYLKLFKSLKDISKRIKKWLEENKFNIKKVDEKTMSLVKKITINDEEEEYDLKLELIKKEKLLTKKEDLIQYYKIIEKMMDNMKKEKEKTESVFKTILEKLNKLDKIEQLEKNLKEIQKENKELIEKINLLESTKEKKEQKEQKIESKEEQGDNIKANKEKEKENLIIKKKERRKSLLNINDQTIPFKKIPNNIQFKLDIIKDAILGGDANFDIFTSSDDSQILAYFNKSRSLIFYDIINNKIKKTIQKPHGSKSHYSISYFYDKINDRDLIITTGEDKVVKVFDYFTLENIVTIKLSKNEARTAILILDNKDNNLYIIVGEFKKKIHVYDINGKLIKDIPSDEIGYFNCGSYTDGDNIYIIQCNEFGVYSFNYRQNSLYKKYLNSPKSYSFSYEIFKEEDVTKLISADTNNSTIRIFNFHTGEIIKIIKNEENKFHIYPMTFINENYVVASGNNSQLGLFDIKNGNYVKGFKGHSCTIWDTKKFKHQNYDECLISMEGTGVIKLWQM